MIRDVTHLIKNNPSEPSTLQPENQESIISIIKSETGIASKCTNCDLGLMKVVTPQGTILHCCKNKNCKTFGRFYQLDPTYSKADLNREWY